MFIPNSLVKVDEDKLFNVLGVKLDEINQDTKEWFKLVNKGELVGIVVGNPADSTLEKEVAACNTLMKYRGRLEYAQEHPTRKSVVNNGVYEHSRLNIQTVRFFPLVKSGTQFTTPNGTYFVVESENHLIGNISSPFYTVRYPDGHIAKGVTQSHILKYTGIQMEPDIKKVASVLVGNPEFNSTWTVSLTKDQTKLYCSSPTHNDYKWERCYDTFTTDCMPFVENAVTRLIMELGGEWFKKNFADTSKAPNRQDRSCYNCRAVRVLTVPDATEGDASRPQIWSKGTDRTRNEGSYDNGLVCGFDMTYPESERTDALNKEITIGYNTSGHGAANNEKYRCNALDCDRYHSNDQTWVRNTAHEVILDGDFVVVKTVGIELYFDKGDQSRQTAPTEYKNTKVDAPVIKENKTAHGLNVVIGAIEDCTENVIAHQSNCQGKYKSGVALALSKKFPSPFKFYVEHCAKSNPEDLLGTMLCVDDGIQFSKKYICHLFGQLRYGRDHKFTNYDALEQGLIEVNNLCRANGYTLAIPFGIGCGTGGGKWEVVEELIAKHVPYATLYKKDAGNILECSTKGDVRFSAFGAVVSAYGITAKIEEHYQRSKEFDGITYKNPLDAKGKVPTGLVIGGRKIDIKYLTAWYKLLWLRYLDANPDLVAHAQKFDDFTDMFRGKSINCQADVIKQYVKQGRESIITEIQEFLDIMGIKLGQPTIVPTGKVVRPGTETGMSVTGHRMDKLGGFGSINNPTLQGVELELEKEVRVAITDGYDTFYTGMANGADLAFGRVILKLKKEFPHIKLIACIPCLEHTAKWQHMKEVLALYAEILAGADEKVIVVEKKYDEDKGCMQKRNVYMVDRVSRIAAVWNGTSGGTKNCIDAAKQNAYLKDIRVIDPTKLIVGAV